MGARILLIEDNDQVLDLMAYLLNTAGHITVAARDGALGLIKARHNGVDLIVCDIGLPKMDGREVLRQVRDDPAFASVPVIAVTGMALEATRDALLAAGFNGFIPKPMHVDTFVGLVEAFLPPALRGRGADDDFSDGETPA